MDVQEKPETGIFVERPADFARGDHVSKGMPVHERESNAISKESSVPAPEDLNDSKSTIRNELHRVVDPEETLDTQPDEKGTDHIYVSRALHLNSFTHVSIQISFGETDPRDPMHFSRRKKWIITAIACAFTVLAAANGATYALGFPSMNRDLGSTPFQAAIGLATYCIGFGVVPLLVSGVFLSRQI